MIWEAEKSHKLPSATWTLRNTGGVAPVPAWKPESQGAHGPSSAWKTGEDECSCSSKENKFHLSSALLGLSMGQMMPTHSVSEGDLSLLIQMLTFPETVYPAD